MKNNYILVIVVIILGLLVLFWPYVEEYASQNALHVTNSGCTLEAKICPDGTAVRRVGPECDFAPCPTDDGSYGVVGSDNAVVDMEITLGVGQKSTFDLGAMNSGTLKLNSVVSDSRCPVDAQCVQAGSVVSNVTFTSGTSTQTVNLSSDEISGHQFGPYTITMTNVSPDRLSKVVIKPTDYQITFHIEKK